MKISKKEEKDFLAKLDSIISKLNDKVDKLEEQVNQIMNQQIEPAPTAFTTLNKNQKKSSVNKTFDKHLWAATREGYTDEDFKKALVYFNNCQGMILSMKQLGWCVYYAPQNHGDCQAEVQKFIKFELNRTGNFNAAKKELIECIVQKYSKYKKTHPDYFNGIIKWVAGIK